ncbi:hypothetical protein [Nostoc sp.]|uniref:hypothetical protein n=1 Tax=Nostoc sp. TaxID=1180 RepID=UPI002FF8624C
MTLRTVVGAASRREEAALTDACGILCANGVSRCAPTPVALSRETRPTHWLDFSLRWATLTAFLEGG